jgi:methylated-DNA-[protein]-cysteine S-methyltransferase
VRADPRILGQHASLEDAIAALRGLAGIGEWTAQYIAMRELREPDAFPAADVGLMRALARRQGTPASPAALRARAERWRPWRAYAALHLWASEATASPATDRCDMPDKPPARLRIDRLPTPIGEALVVTDDAGFLRAFDWADCETGMARLLRLHYGALTPQPGRAPADLMRRLRRYFDGDLGALDGIAWRTSGTPFQRKVWQGLTKIRPGETLNYGALAATLGCASAVRAVGAANGANPISVVVPCHRVIGADGSLTGYGGGIARKRWLLRHEGAAFRDVPVKDIRKRAA